MPTRTRVLVLQHPREADKAVGTARIAARCLPSAEIAVGIDFANDARVQALAADPERPAMLLYPGPQARDVRSMHIAGPITLVVLDGTWSQARSLKRDNPWLAALPQIAFQPDRPSEYRIRSEPHEDFVSTIEALALTLGALEGDSERFLPLLAPFRAMVEVQLAFAARSSGGRKRFRRRSSVTTPARLPQLLTEPNLLCVMAEANAWPYDASLKAPPYPHELLQWSAFRPRTGERFEALIAPRMPLSPSPVKHAGLDEASIHAGCSLDEFMSRWSAFLKPDDVLCTWGYYSVSLMHRENAPLPTRYVEIRKVAGDYLKRRPGSAEQLTADLDMSWQPLGQARCGKRLGMLVALTTWLSTLAQGEPTQPAGVSDQA